MTWAPQAVWPLLLTAPAAENARQALINAGTIRLILTISCSLRLRQSIHSPPVILHGLSEPESGHII